jgi:hypothetical protein
MPATNRICVLGAPRTGSTLLRSLLDSQKGVIFAGEIYHPKQVSLHPKLRRHIPEQERTVAARDADPVGFLAHCAEVCPEPSFGLKLFQGHSKEVREHVIRAPDWKIVILHRDNFLAVYASRLAARETGAWSSHWQADGEKASEDDSESSGERPQRPRVRFDVAVFLKSRDTYLNYYDTLLKKCVKAGKVFYLIEYTDLLREEMVQNLAWQVGLPHTGRFTTVLRKQGASDVLSRFTNPEDALRTIERVARPDWAQEQGPKFQAQSRNGPDARTDDSWGERHLSRSVEPQPL